MYLNRSNPLRVDTEGTVIVLAHETAPLRQTVPKGSNTNRIRTRFLCKEFELWLRGHPRCVGPTSGCSCYDQVRCSGRALELHTSAEESSYAEPQPKYYFCNKLVLLLVYFLGLGAG